MGHDHIRRCCDVLLRCGLGNDCDMCCTCDVLHNVLESRHRRDVQIVLSMEVGTRVPPTVCEDIFPSRRLTSYNLGSYRVDHIFCDCAWGLKLDIHAAMVANYSTRDWQGARHPPPDHNAKHDSRHHIYDCDGGWVPMVRSMDALSGRLHNKRRARRMSIRTLIDGGLQYLTNRRRQSTAGTTDVVCGSCGGEIIEVNTRTHRRACFDCGREAK